MKFKKIMLIALLLLAVLTIGTVSATEDVDTLAVDDTGDETIVEAPVDEDATQTAVADEDIVEAEQNTDTLASPYANFNDEVYSEYHSVCSISDYSNGINGTVSLFANDTQVYEQEIAGEEFVSIMAKDIIGSFYGTYNMKVIYNGTDGTNYEKEGTVTFTKAIINKVWTPDDFKVTFLTSEIDIDKGDSVIITYFCPEGIKEHSSNLYVYYGDGKIDYHAINMELADVGTYKNITWGSLYVYNTGVYNLSVRYSEDGENFLELGNATIIVTDNHVYSSEDIISIYNYVGTGVDEDCLADIYDGEIEGLDGVVTAYANGTQIYTKSYSNYNKGGPIHAKDLTTNLNGIYNVKVEYNRTDGKVFSVTKNVCFDIPVVVPDTRPWIRYDVNVKDITYGNDVSVTFSEENNLPYNGTVSVEIWDYTPGAFRKVASIIVASNNGSGSAKLSGIAVGNYTAEVISNDTEIYKAGYGYKEFTVKKALSEILFYDTVIDMDAGIPSNLTIDFEKASGINAHVDGENATVNGNLIMIPALSIGNHTLVISTIADENHTADTKEVTLNVTKQKARVIFDKNIVLYQGSSVNVTVETLNALGFNASIEGHPEALNVNGNVLTISGLSPGTYSLYVTSIADENHLAVTEKATITVKRLIAEIEFGSDKIVFDEGSSGSIIANVSNGGIAKAIIIAHTEAIINIKGYNITVSNLNAGNYTLSVTSKPNSGYSANIKSINVIVNPVEGVKVNSSVSVSDVELDYGTTKNVTVETIGAIGFTAKIDGVDAEVHNNYVIVPVLDEGTHTLSVTTIPDASHLAVSKNATITVNKLATAVSASEISVVYAASKNIVVTLKDANGNPLANKKVAIKFNNVDYSGTTDNDGKASIIITKTSVTPKTYASTITFAGDGTYAKSTGNVNVVVTKATPKITVKAKTFKKSVKTKKYTITLKDNLNKVMKNAKVTIKVNKKTYSAKTGNNGVAIFKITKLTKKGKYTATVTYTGSKYYNKVTKKVKITIK